MNVVFVVCVYLINELQLITEVGLDKKSQRRHCGLI